MRKTKFGSALLLTLTLGVSPLAALASSPDTAKVSASAQTPSGTDKFMLTIESLCPNCAEAARGVGKDLEAKCGVPPTEKQYREIVKNSPPYTIRLAELSLDKGDDKTEWTAQDRSNYKAAVDKLDCSQQ